MLNILIMTQINWVSSNYNSMFSSFAHGSNDVAVATNEAAITLYIKVIKLKKKLMYLFRYCYLVALVFLGLITWGYKIGTELRELTKITPSRGFDEVRLLYPVVRAGQKFPFQQHIVKLVLEVVD